MYRLSNFINIMKLAYLFSLLLFAFLLESCFISIQKEIPGLKSGYYNLSNDNLKSINLTKEVYPRTLNAITGSDLSKLLSLKDSSMVYIWSPDCSSDVCIPLFVFTQYCFSQNLEPIIVVEYINLEKTLPQFDDTSTYYLINFLKYQTDFVNKYKKKIKCEMINNSSVNIRQTLGHRYYKFIGNSFLSSQLSINELER